MSNVEGKLKVLQLAPFAFPVGKTARYGGIEQVVNDLDNELLKQGHESLVVATGDSEISGQILPTFESSLWKSQPDKEDGWKYQKGEFDYTEKFNLHSEIALKHIVEHNPDVVHDHFGFIKSVAFQEAKNLPPILYTLHDPIDPQSKQRLKEIKNSSNGKVFFNAISYSQKRFFEDHVKVDYVVYNAVDVEDYPFSPEGKGFVLHLGLLNKPKGTDIALDVAKKLEKKIIVAGPILTGRVHQKNSQGAVGSFWEDVLRPKIDYIHKELIEPVDVGRFVDWFVESSYSSAYVGELNFNQKKEWFSRADVFYFPIRREEPFGLVMIEAMAGGTPVVAYNKGAIPEIVKDGITGFVVDGNFEGPVEDVTGHKLELTNQGLANFCDAASRVGTLSRMACRKYAEQNFTIARQTKDYINVYRDMRKKLSL